MSLMAPAPAAPAAPMMYGPKFVADIGHVANLEVLAINWGNPRRFESCRSRGLCDRGRVVKAIDSNPLLT